MIIEVSVPIITKARAAGSSREELCLTRVPFSYNFQVGASADIPIIAEWRDDNWNHIVRRSEGRGNFLALNRNIPENGDLFDIDLWSISTDPVMQCLTESGNLSEGEISSWHSEDQVTPFYNLQQPDLEMIEQQIDVHRQILGGYLIVDGGIYEPCEQPYLALFDTPNKLSLEPRLEYLNGDHEPGAKFSMTDGENVIRWLRANLTAFSSEAVIKEFRCTRPDLFEDGSIKYSCYSLVRTFATGVNQLIYQTDAIRLTYMIAVLTEAEAELCINADKIDDLDQDNGSNIDFEKTAREILAISQDSPLWPAFKCAELLEAFREQAARAIGIRVGAPLG